MKAFHKFVAEKNRKRRMQLCADIEDELDDPSYVSCTPSGSEEEEVVSAPKVADKKRKEQDNPNPRKVKLPKLDPVRSPSPEFEHQQKKKEKTGVQKEKKRLHHRREENPICKRRFMTSFATCGNTQKRLTLVQTKSCTSAVWQKGRVGGEAQVVLVPTSCDSLSQGPSTPAEADDCIDLRRTRSRSRVFGQ